MKKLLSVIGLCSFSFFLTACNQEETSSEPKEEVKTIEINPNQNTNTAPTEDPEVAQKRAEFDRMRQEHARNMHMLQQEMQAKVDAGEIEWETMRKALWDAEKNFRNGMTEKIEAAQEEIKEDNNEEKGSESEPTEEPSANAGSEESLEIKDETADMNEMTLVEDNEDTIEEENSEN